LGSVVMSLVLLFVGGVPAHVIGYVLGSFVPILLIAGFRSKDRRSRLSPNYSPRPEYDWFARIGLGVALIVTVAHILPIATEVAR
jgi:hypothetical protein